MNGYDHWSAHDWVRHYAGPRYHPHYAQVGSAWDEYGRRLPDAAPRHQTGAIAPAPPQHLAGPGPATHNCPASRTPLLMVGLALGAGLYFFGPRPSPKVVEETKKKVAGAASVAAGVLGQATRKISQATTGLGEKAERYARKRA